jgi:hypothetical protein
MKQDFQDCTPAGRKQIVHLQEFKSRFLAHPVCPLTHLRTSFPAIPSTL